MPDTAPGRITDAHGWPGQWETVSREDYWAAVAENGGLRALGVASSCTHPHGDNYVLTAWGRRDQDYPLVQNELEGCNTTSPDHYASCPGVHTFSRFIYDPAQAEED
jgi:hypothetical protein